jgi:ABC-type multidrug transport system fused ATPase/permease subunit
VVPILLQQAIDTGISRRVQESAPQVNIDRVMILCLFGGLWLLVAGFAQRTAVARLGRRSEKALYDLRVKIFEHIHRLSLEDHNDEKRGALVARVTSDVETLSQFFSYGGLAFLLNGALMIIVAAVMLSYNWLLALVVFIVSAPLVGVLRRVQGHLVAAYDATRQANANLLASAAELVSGAETIRAYHGGDEFAGRVRRAAALRAKAQVRASFIGSLLFPSGEVFGVLAVSSVLAVGIGRGPSAGLTAGALVGFIFLTYRFLEPIAELTEVIDQTQTAVAGLRRVLGVLAIPIGPLPAPHPVLLPPGPLDIRFDQVTFRYRARQGLDGFIEEPPALRDVSLSISFGTYVAIVGDTGSGKTTFGRLLARFSDPTTGVITVGGVPLTQVDNDDLRHRLVVVPQEPFLFDDTIGANLRFARPDVTDAHLVEVFAELGLADWFETMSAGLDTPVGQRGAHLSAGERQLVALARAALVNPSILVLDEATSSVDALTEVRLARALENLARGRTTIAIAHRLSTAARADRILVIDRGRVVEDGSHLALVNGAGVYSSLFAAWLQATSSGES